VLNLDSKTLIFISKCLGLTDLEMVGMFTIVRSNLKNNFHDTSIWVLFHPRLIMHDSLMEGRGP
jgi:hypothetical protein